MLTAHHGGTIRGVNRSMNSVVFIGLGSNMGDREKNLREALEKIGRFIIIDILSSVYETEPVDVEDQGWFLNMVLKGTTGLSPVRLLEKLQETEKLVGRKATFSKGPRIIDLDILFYDHIVLESANLEIPHPEIKNRGFVLTPLHEIAPDFIHPVWNKDISFLMNNLNQKKQVRTWTKAK